MFAMHFHSSSSVFGTPLGAAAVPGPTGEIQAAAEGTRELVEVVLDAPSPLCYWQWVGAASLALVLPLQLRSLHALSYAAAASTLSAQDEVVEMQAALMHQQRSAMEEMTAAAAGREAAAHQEFESASSSRARTNANALVNKAMAD